MIEAGCYTETRVRSPEKPPLPPGASDLSQRCLSFYPLPKRCQWETLDSSKAGHPIVPFFIWIAIEGCCSTCIRGDAESIRQPMASQFRYPREMFIAEVSSRRFYSHPSVSTEQVEQVEGNANTLRTSVSLKPRTHLDIIFETLLYSNKRDS